jgi:ADP-dependent phosphofructokinase/glucokinase
MKKEWIQKYREIEQPEFNSTILTGFNANIDIINRQKTNENLKEKQAEKKDEVKNKEDLLKAIKYCKKEDSSYEAQLRYSPEIEGEKRLGGQAGIIANLMNRLGNKSIFYTPFLSQKLANKIDEEVLYPVNEDSFGFKTLKNSINSDRTKENFIIEFKESNNRLILSDNLRGFEPFFRESVAEKIGKERSEIDRIILSGFHDTQGNTKAKLKKAEKQLEKIDKSKHLEYVQTSPEKTSQILEHIAPHFTSIGLDQEELQQIAKGLGKQVNDQPTLQEAYKISKKIIEEVGVQRVHIHTKKYHTTITKNTYSLKPEEILKAMLKSSLTAAKTAQKGETPEHHQIQLDTNQMHLKKLDPLEKFQEKHNLEDFKETGTAKIQDYKITAIPPVITENPEKIVGLGDIISATAFAAEINN